MIHLYTGDGKGKTTAAVGLAVRACGHKRRVLFVQFLKTGPTGELKGLGTLGVRVLRTLHPHGFWWTLDARERIEVVDENNRLLREVLAACRGPDSPDVLVLDEFTYLFKGEMAERGLCEELLAVVKERQTETVITGRDPGPLAEVADYLSEIKAVKHPFTHGQPARAGIEY